LVEPTSGSPMRAIPPFWEGAPESLRSLFFWFYAAGKRSVALDLDDDALLRLVATADVLLESEPPGRLPLDALRGASPRLVVASITPFGQRGPYRDWKASDTVAQAL